MVEHSQSVLPLAVPHTVHRHLEVIHTTGLGIVQR